jgi:hypothetical protein
MSGTCQSHPRPVLHLREALQNYMELSYSTPPFLVLCFHEKDLPPTPMLLQVWLILPPLGHILSEDGRFCPDSLLDHIAAKVFAPEMDE